MIRSLRDDRAALGSRYPAMLAERPEEADGEVFRSAVVTIFPEPDGLDGGATTGLSRLVNCRTKPAERKRLE